MFKARRELGVIGNVDYLATLKTKFKPYFTIDSDAESLAQVTNDFLTTKGWYPTILSDELSELLAKGFQGGVDVLSRVKDLDRTVFEALNKSLKNPAFKSAITANPIYIDAWLFLYGIGKSSDCLLYTSPSPRDATLSRMPSSA